MVGLAARALSRGSPPSMDSYNSLQMRCLIIKLFIHKHIIWYVTNLVDNFYHICILHICMFAYEICCSFNDIRIDIQ